MSFDIGCLDRRSRSFQLQAHTVSRTRKYYFQNKRKMMIKMVLFLRICWAAIKLVNKTWRACQKEMFKLKPGDNITVTMELNIDL